MRREQKANMRIFSEHFFLFSVRPLHTTISEYTHFNPCFAFLYSPRGLRGTVNHSQIILNIYIYIYLLCSIWTYCVTHTNDDDDLYALCSSSSRTRGLPEKYSARCVDLPTYIGGVRVYYVTELVSITFYYNAL